MDLPIERLGGTISHKEEENTEYSKEAEIFHVEFSIEFS
jgi:hypothetical protein